MNQELSNSPTRVCLALGSRSFVYFFEGPSDAWFEFSEAVLVDVSDFYFLNDVVFLDYAVIEDSVGGDLSGSCQLVV
jgi:hypothetical protein